MYLLEAQVLSVIFSLKIRFSSLFVTSKIIKVLVSVINLAFASPDNTTSTSIMSQKPYPIKTV